MRPPEFVRALLHKGRQDEAVLEALLPDRQFDDETVGFHAQQAVEKLLKAWLSHRGIDYPKVHRLETLLDLLSANGCELPEDAADVVSLTPFGTVFRYEDLPLDIAFDRQRALQVVRTVRAYVEAQIGETSP